MSTEPITLEEAKLHLKVDSADDNALISSLITTARQFVESWTHRILITTTVEKTYDVPSHSFSLPSPPLQEVTKIEVVNDDGEKTLVDSSIYDYDSSVDIPGRVKLKSGCTWPDHRDFASFIVTFKAGYGDAATDVPEMLRQAILQVLAHYYESRQSEEIPAGIYTLLAPFKVYWL